MCPVARFHVYKFRLCVSDASIMLFSETVRLITSRERRLVHRTLTY